MGCYLIPMNNGDSGYRGMLDRESLCTEGLRLFGNDWIFQQDNAAIHNELVNDGHFS